MSASPRVTRCVCHDVSFERVLALRDEHDPGRTLGEDDMLELIKRRTHAGSSCALCRPYLRLCLRTGRVSLPVLTPAQAAAVEAGRTP